MSVEQLEDYAHVITALHKKWKPHPGQLAPGQAIFYEGIKRIFLRAARQVGKSEFCSYVAIRWALTKPNSRIFILAPFLAQCRTLYLHSGLIQNKCPDEFPVEIHIGDGRFIFPNGSQIRLLGGDNFDAARGITADLVIIDEVKDVPDQVWPVIYPTLLVRKAPLILAGTPPGNRNAAYWQMVEEAETNPLWRIFKLKTTDNPFIDPNDVAEERRKHEARGTINEFLREYEAEYAVDSAKAVFPMFERERHVKAFEPLLHEVRARPKHWDFVVSCDPAHASTFAVLFAAVNKHDGRVRFLDELYIQDQAKTSIGTVWPLVQAKMNEIHPSNDESEWTIVMDEAATGVRVELLDVFDVSAIPTQKATNRKSFGISLLKDLYIEDKLLVSDRCKNFVYETENYFLSETGEFIKKNDHLCSDCARYALHAVGYTAQPSTPPPAPRVIPDDERRRGFSPQEDYETLTTYDTPVYSFEIEDAWE